MTRTWPVTRNSTAVREMLEARYSSFDKQPFNDASVFHVSVYRA